MASPGDLGDVQGEGAHPLHIGDDMDGAINWANQTELPEDVRRTVNSIAERMQNDNER